MTPFEIGDKVRIISNKYTPGQVDIMLPSRGICYLPPVGHEDIVESTPYWYPSLIRKNFVTLKNWFLGDENNSSLTIAIVPDCIIKIK